MLFSIHRQPLSFKTLFLLCDTFTTLFVRLPLWLVIYTPPFMRIKRGWSLKRMIMIRWWQHISSLGRMPVRLLEFPDHRAIAPGEKGDWIDPLPEQLLVGRIREMATVAGEKPIRLPGYWIDKEGHDIPFGAPPHPGEKVVFHLHGGAYVFLSASPSDPTAGISRGLLERHQPIQRVFSIEYRLTLTPEGKAVNPFPTQLIDALSGYYYLVHTVGFNPADIIVDGDSAGGNLALALTRYLVDNQGRPDVEIPAPPGRLLLISPWCDMSPVRAVPGSSWVEFASTDYIDGVDIPKKAEYFCGPFGLSEAEVNEYISPASTHPELEVSFKGFPSTFLLCGGSEVFRDQIHVLRDRMVRDLGEEDVAYYEPPDAIHDFLNMTWLEPERTNSWNEIGRWLARY
ncbi:alpha/beta-hydrolase [Gloeophyllum trabeum ATCC 11539]|uniref:Alpha/beta-hydrolase n=1 Tax=Gloeophyllum trabeum (strain ATCC 11539 / FP-39264 / Madison 617) TaxID=670483 RepID=S7QCM3_GLOTA|nr:alpha/beta-hydrolase [Gloeophyllum trabeum ATCC 11539]EPQ57631.1 alpha/beta-hydrolase [Gloeophyllum trabeum ATCC 11539]